MAYKANTAANTGYSSIQIYARKWRRGMGMGDVYGYANRGIGPATPIPGPTYRNTIERFPFASFNTSGSDIGDMTTTHQDAAGFSDAEYGYSAGGEPATTAIDRYPFAASTTNATDAGDLTVAKRVTCGFSSTEYGYVAGGFNPATPARINEIERLPFAVGDAADMVDVGNLTGTRFSGMGSMSTTHGYHMGGNESTPVISDAFERVPFSTDTANATDIGNLTTGKDGGTGHSSESHGYFVGGESYPSTGRDDIEKFSFSASATNATDVASLTTTRHDGAGSSSPVAGFVAGGSGPPASPPTRQSAIDRFPFATESAAVDIGDLTTARYLMEPGNVHV